MNCCFTTTSNPTYATASESIEELETIGSSNLKGKWLVMNEGHLELVDCAMFSTASLVKHLAAYIKANPENIHQEMPTLAVRGLRRVAMYSAVAENKELQDTVLSAIRSIDDQVTDAMQAGGVGRHKRALNDFKKELSECMNEFTQISLRALHAQPMTEIECRDGMCTVYGTFTSAWDVRDSFWKKVSKEAIELINEYTVGRLEHANISSDLWTELVDLAPQIYADDLEEALKDRTFVSLKTPFVPKNLLSRNDGAPKGRLVRDHLTELYRRDASLAWLEDQDELSPTEGPIIGVMTQLFDTAQSPETLGLIDEIEAKLGEAEHLENWASVSFPVWSSAHRYVVED